MCVCVGGGVGGGGEEVGEGGRGRRLNFTGFRLSPLASIVVKTYICSARVPAFSSPTR